MSLVLSPAIGIASTAVLLSHETGHWFSALCRGAEPSAPIIIPLGVASIGITPVENFSNLSPRARRYIIASGPTAGVATTVGLIPYALIMGSMSLNALAVIGIAELYSGIFGSDGSKLRALLRDVE